MAAPPVPVDGAGEQYACVILAVTSIVAAQAVDRGQQLDH